MIYCCEAYRDRDNCCDDASCLSPLLVEADMLRRSNSKKVHLSDIFGFHILWRLSIAAVALLLVSGASASNVDANPSSYRRSERIRTESVSKNGVLPAEQDVAGYERNGHDSNSVDKDKGVLEAQHQNPSHKIDVNRHSILQIQVRISSNSTDSVQASSTDNVCKNSQGSVNQSKKRWFVQFDELPVHQTDQVQIHNKQHVQVRWTCDSAHSSFLGTGFASLLVPLRPHNPRETSSKTSGERTLLVALLEESGEDNGSHYPVMLARRLANLPRFEHPATDYPRKSQDNLVVTLELPGRTTLVTATPKSQENTRRKDTKFSFSLCTVDIICIASFCVSAMIAKLGSGYKVALPSTERCNRGLESSRATPLQNIAPVHAPTLVGATREVCDEVEHPFTSGPMFTSPSPPTYPMSTAGQFPYHDDNHDKHSASTVQKNCEKISEYPSPRSPPSLLNRRLTTGDFPFPPAGYGPLLPASREEKIIDPANVFMGEIIPRSRPPLCRGLFSAGTSSEHVSHYESMSTEKSLPAEKSQFHVSPRAGACAIRKCLETLQNASATVGSNEVSALDHQESFHTSGGTATKYYKTYQNQQTGIVHQTSKRQVSEIEHTSEQAEVDDNDIDKMAFPSASHNTALTSIQNRAQNSEIGRSNEFITHGGISHTGESLVPRGTFKSAQQVRHGKIKNDAFSSFDSCGKGRQQDCAVEKVCVLRSTPKISTIVKNFPPVRMETDSKIPKSSSVTASPPPDDYDEGFQQFHITRTGGTAHSKSTLHGKKNTSNNDTSYKERMDSKSRPETKWLQRLATGTTPAKPSSGQSNDFEFDEEEHSPKPGIYVVGMEQIREHANKRHMRSTKETFSYVSTLPAENESSSNGKGKAHTPVGISNSKKNRSSACKGRKDIPEVIQCFTNLNDMARQIVSTSDKNLVTKLTFTVFDQLRACKDGAECKHCYMESKAFSFPLHSSRRIANLQAATRRHLMVACPNATENLRDKLRRLEEQQTREYQKVKPTGQEEFFSLVWDRLQIFSSTGTTKSKKKTGNEGKGEDSFADEDSASLTSVKIAAKPGSDQLFDSNLCNDKQRLADFDPNRSRLLSKFGRKQKKKRVSTFVPDVAPSTSLVNVSHQISEPPAWQFGEETTGLLSPELVSTANQFDLRGKNSSKKRRLK